VADRLQPFAASGLRRHRRPRHEPLRSIPPKAPRYPTSAPR
jgi:hypothetical protein